MLKKILKILILILKGNSILRTLQITECYNITLSGTSIEFGAYTDNSKNFNIHFKGNSKLKISNIYYSKLKNYIKINLTKKFKIKKNYFDNVIIFNVLEHLENNNNFFIQIKKNLKKGGSIIGSTPFLYQIHGAPLDYYRFSKDFFYKIKKKYKFRKVYVKSLGFGPLTASYSLIFGYIKFFPILKEFFLIICFIFDAFIQLFVKTKLSEIYPIGYFFIIKK